MSELGSGQTSWFSKGIEFKNDVYSECKKIPLMISTTIYCIWYNFDCSVIFHFQQTKLLITFEKLKKNPVKFYIRIEIFLIVKILLIIKRFENEIQVESV